MWASCVDTVCGLGDSVLKGKRHGRGRGMGSSAERAWSLADAVRLVRGERRGANSPCCMHPCTCTPAQEIWLSTGPKHPPQGQGPKSLCRLWFCEWVLRETCGNSAIFSCGVNLEVPRQGLTILSLWRHLVYRILGYRTLDSRGVLL